MILLAAPGRSPANYVLRISFGLNHPVYNLHGRVNTVTGDKNRLIIGIGLIEERFQAGFHDRSIASQWNNHTHLGGAMRQVARGSLSAWSLPGKTPAHMDLA
jgi:hypothetical protein